MHRGFGQFLDIRARPMELTSSKAPGRPASAGLFFFDQGWRAQISIRSPVFRYDLARGVDGAGAGAGASNFRFGSRLCKNYFLAAETKY